ncbi:MAG: ribonuclease H-like domain-containing protein [Candidatus Omnitrophica bacterium]|nr:ribonuclease H-like domain-containing protein [Candidatus Omnitrophota bacterium]
MDLTKDIECFDLVVFDLETTGLDAVTGDSICEIGAFKVRNRKIIDKFHSLINPKRSIPMQAYNIHKISEEEVKNAPCFEDVADKFVSFLDQSVIFAYNIKFDMSFINNHLGKLNQPSLELPAVDILSMARNVLELPRYNLDSVARSFDIDCSQGLHRALYDASIACQVLMKLFCILNEKGIRNLGEFVSLYGLNNEIFKEKEEKKIDIFNLAIKERTVFKIKHFSSNNVIEEKEVLPLRVVLEGKHFYLLCQDKDKDSFSIRVSRILKIINLL